MLSVWRQTLESHKKWCHPFSAREVRAGSSLTWQMDGDNLRLKVDVQAKASRQTWRVHQFQRAVRDCVSGEEQALICVFAYSRSCLFDLCKNLSVKPTRWSFSRSWAHPDVFDGCLSFWGAGSHIFFFTIEQDSWALQYLCVYFFMLS